MNGYVSASEAAKIIGCNDSRIRQLLRENKLKGGKVGRAWLVLAASAEAWRDSARKPGPKKA